jgi:hypothetical protein
MGDMDAQRRLPDASRAADHRNLDTIAALGELSKENLLLLLAPSEVRYVARKDLRHKRAESRRLIHIVNHRWPAPREITCNLLNVSRCRPFEMRGRAQETDVKFLQAPAGIHPEFVAHEAAVALVDLQSFRGTSGPMQGEHDLFGKPLADRITGYCIQNLVGHFVVEPES